VDYLFLSAARVYGPGVLAVVLTGMGSDGLDGARAVYDRGGLVLAQDEASSAVWGMPGRVAESGIASAVLPLDGLAREINQRIGADRSGKAGTLSSSSIATRRREVSHGLY
jgi:two-component system chemotaxis response regulator CheB